MRFGRFVLVAAMSMLLAAESEPLFADSLAGGELEDLLQQCRDFAQAGHASGESYSDVARHKKAMTAICAEWEKLMERPPEQQAARAEEMQRLCTREAMSGRDLDVKSGSDTLTPHKKQGVALCEQLFRAVTE